MALQYDESGNLIPVEGTRGPAGVYELIGPGATPTDNPGGLLSSVGPIDVANLTPEEQAQIRESQLAAYTGPSVTAGDVELPSTVVTAPTLTEGTSYVTPEMTVQGQLEQILAAGSPLQTLAESRAEEEAQKRGLLSSSMAIGAGQKALYDTALEVAKPDAQTYGAFGKTQQEGEYDITKTGYEGDIAAALKTAEKQGEAAGMLLQGQIQSELQGQQEAARQTLLETELASKEAMQQFQATEDYNKLITELASREGIATMEAQARFDQAYMETMAEIDFKNTELQAKVAVEYSKISSDDKGAFLDSMKYVMNAYQEALSKIQAVPSDQLTGAQKQQYIGQLQTQYMDQIDFLASVYGTPVHWEVGDFSQPGSTTSPDTTGTTGGTTSGITQPTYPGTDAGLGVTGYPIDQPPTSGTMVYNNTTTGAPILQYDYGTGQWEPILEGTSGFFGTTSAVMVSMMADTLNTNETTPDTFSGGAVGGLTVDQALVDTGAYTGTPYTAPTSDQGIDTTGTTGTTGVLDQNQQLITDPNLITGGTTPTTTQPTYPTTVPTQPGTYGSVDVSLGPTGILNYAWNDPVTGVRTATTNPDSVPLELLGTGQAVDIPSYQATEIGTGEMQYDRLIVETWSDAQVMDTWERRWLAGHLGVLDYQKGIINPDYARQETQRFMDTGTYTTTQPVNTTGATTGSYSV
jgi:hypothetical protein